MPLNREGKVEITGGRPTVRLRGNANNGNCSARYMNANNAASNTNRNNAGSAKSGFNEELRMKNLPLPTKIIHSPAKRVFFIHLQRLSSRVRERRINKRPCARHRRCVAAGKSRPNCPDCRGKEMKRISNISINLSVSDVGQAARRAFEGHLPASGNTADKPCFLWKRWK